MAWHGRDVVWHVMVGIWYGMVWHGMVGVWYGMAW